MADGASAAAKDADGRGRLRRCGEAKSSRRTMTRAPEMNVCN